MNKENIICFRTSKHLHESLAKAAKKDRRSLSSMIEMALMNYLKERESFRNAENEKRQYPRKTLSVPAVIHQPDRGQMAVGSIEEISLSGVRVILPKDFPQQILIDSHGTRFEIVFNIPPENNPVRISCESVRIVDAEDGMRIGAFFVDADFKSYKAVQTYVI